MRYRDEQLIEMLAAEYAIGTLHGAARRRFEALRSQRDDIDRETLYWEQALAELALDLPPETPSARNWSAIRDRVRALQRKTAPRRPVTAFWRATAVAAMLALVFVVTYLPREPQPVTPDQPAQVAVIQDKGNAALWRVRVTDTVEVRHIGAGALDADKDYELWLLTESGPQSIGLLPQAGDARLDVSPEMRRQLQRGGSIAVSIEPAGGSPQPTPTGPVIAVAPLVSG